MLSEPTASSIPPDQSLATGLQTAGGGPELRADSIDIVDQDPSTLTSRTRVRKRLDDPGRDVLAGHLDEAQGRDLEQLGAGPVLLQLVPEGLEDVLSVPDILHIDEVDDDDPADVSE